MKTGNFYVVKDDAQYGPFSFKEIAETGYNSPFMFWTEGLSDWVSVSDKQDFVERFYNQLSGTANIPLPADRTTHRAKLETVLGVLGNQAHRWEYPSIAIRLIGITLLVVISFLIARIFGVLDSLIMIFLFFMPLVSAVSYHFLSGNIIHNMLGMKVVSIKDKSEFRSSVKGFLREFIKALSFCLFFPSLIVLMNKKKRGLHDFIFGTVVINK